jgi:hypothetical protein
MMKNMTIPESTIGSSLPPIQTVWVKSGYALGPEGSLFRSARPLRIEIEGVRLLSPAQIRDLLQNRTSLEEVKMLIEEEADPSYIFQGKIMIENYYYSLVDVDLRCRDSEMILKANLSDDLADLREGDEGVLSPGTEDGFIGHIEMSDCSGTSKGRLVISQGTLSGRYTFLPEQDKDGGILHDDGPLILH